MPNPIPLSPNPPPTAAPSLYSESGGYSPAELALVHQISGAVLSPCSHEPSAEGDGTLAALNCTSVNAGPVALPLLILKFSDASAMAAWLDQPKVPSASAQSCLGGDYQSTWADGGVTCRLEGPGDLRIFWTDSANLIGAIADGPTDATLIDWWQANCRFLTQQ